MHKQEASNSSQSTVTVNVPYGMTEFFDFKNSTPELLIETWAGHPDLAQACGTSAASLADQGRTRRLGEGRAISFHGTLLEPAPEVAPDHAAVFAKAGWGPKEIREAIHRKDQKLKFRGIMLNQEYDAFRQAHPELSWLEDAPDTMVTVNPSADCFEFFVVGAKAGRSQFCFWRGPICSD